MANPQTEDGYTRIANELMDAFARLPSLGSEAFQVLMLILRRTYGFNRKEAELSLNYIAKGTGLKNQAVSRALERLSTKRLIVRDGSTIKLNKNYQDWVSTKRLDTNQTVARPPTKRLFTPPTKRLDNKETVNKETSKETFVADEPVTVEVSTPVQGAEDGDWINNPSVNPKDVAELIDIFVKAGNKTLRFGNITQRGACERLIADIGIQKALTRARYAASVQRERYAPVITTPLELEQKMQKLETYYDREHRQQGNVAFIS